MEARCGWTIWGWRIWGWVVCLSFFSLCSTLTATPRVVYVMRHAEKPHPTESGGSLSPVGRVRAAKLADFRFLKQQPDAMFCNTVRTHQTITPLANRLQITPCLFPLDEVQAMADAAHAMREECVLLVCSEHHHIPAFVKAFTQTIQLSSWGDNVFDRILILKTNKKGGWDVDDVRQGSVTAEMQKHAESIATFSEFFARELESTKSVVGSNAPHLNATDLCYLLQEKPNQPYSYSVDGAATCSGNAAPLSSTPDYPSI